MSDRRRLFFDIETSPAQCFVWKTGYQINVSHEAIIKEGAIICIAYKWEGQSKVYHLEWDSKQSDKSMLVKFLKIADQASEIIGHNGDNFDLKWIRTRCFYHNIPMMPDYTTIDTLKEARKGFRFNSNKLDYISKYSGGAGKNHTSFDLWIDICLKKCKKSMKTMTDYCKVDVLRLEEVFIRMNKYIKPKTSVADYKSNCPECGSENVGVNAYKVSAAGVKYVQLQCKDCGKYHKVNANSYATAVGKREKDKILAQK
jgi:uncharacterized protein YprB with RNaseH-like and TPR domain